MEIRELHEIATMYTNIAEALSFVNEYKPHDVIITVEEIKADDNGKGIALLLSYEWGDNVEDLAFDFDVDYRRSTMIEDILKDVERFVKECENERI